VEEAEGLPEAEEGAAVAAAGDKLLRNRKGTARKSDSLSLPVV
jgi:hypothetical protein